MMGNHNCGSVATARVCETFGSAMVVLDLPVSVILPGGDFEGCIYFDAKADAHGREEAGASSKRCVPGGVT
jgi:hypothetical protein